MTASFSEIINYITLHSFIISILLAIGVLLSGYKKRKNHIFFGLLFALSLNNAYFFLYHSNLFSTYPVISAICFSGIFLLGPFIWAFTQISVNPVVQFSKTTLLHFIPVILSVFISTLSVFLGGNNITSPLFKFFNNTTFSILAIFGSTSFVCYLAVSGYISVKHLIKQPSAIKREPLKMASLIVILFFIILFFIDILILLTSKTHYLQYVSFLLSVCIVLLFLINTVFPGLEKVSDKVIEKRRQQKSYLQNTDKSELQQKVETLITDGIYLDSELTLQKLAGRVGVTPHQLSEYINKHFDKNFTAFINQHRVTKAKELLLSKNNFTIEAIAFEVGFNSKSAFNAAFRKLESMSPSEFKNKYFLQKTLT